MSVLLLSLVAEIVHQRFLYAAAVPAKIDYDLVTACLLLKLKIDCNHGSLLDNAKDAIVISRPRNQNQRITIWRPLLDFDSFAENRWNQNRPITSHYVNSTKHTQF